MLTVLDEPNVLVLDEPTNDVDIDMLSATEDLLDSWPGTLIVVSHDRYLLGGSPTNSTQSLTAISDTCRGIDEYLRMASPGGRCVGCQGNRCRLFCSAVRC